MTISHKTAREALLRCPGIDTTDQVLGITFRKIVIAALPSPAEQLAADQRRQRRARPDYRGMAGERYPASGWCKGPHPRGDACSECGPILESHLAMKAAGY